jgi:hypothetical protein
MGKHSSNSSMHMSPFWLKPAHVKLIIGSNEKHSNENPCERHHCCVSQGDYNFQSSFATTTTRLAHCFGICACEFMNSSWVIWHAIGCRSMARPRSFDMRGAGAPSLSLKSIRSVRSIHAW